MLTLGCSHLAWLLPLASEGASQLELVWSRENHQVQRSRTGTSSVSPAPPGVGCWWSWVGRLDRRGRSKRNLPARGRKAAAFLGSLRPAGRDWRGAQLLAKKALVSFLLLHLVVLGPVRWRLEALSGSTAFPFRSLPFPPLSGPLSCHCGTSNEAQAKH